MSPLLEVKNLRIELTTRDGVAPVIDDLSFTLNPGETMSFVGESGCGKSMTALALMGLLPEKVGRVAAGNIIFDGEDLSQASDERLRAIRGNEISMIFQEPMTSLNPVFKVGDQIAETIMLHQGSSKDEAMDKAVELLRVVGIPEPTRRASSYPHELSGGMRQRVMIAIAISCQPQILIADEPTTALDVTVQAQIFELMREIQEEFGVAIMMITHDMGAIAEMADRVAVMYAGKIIEEGKADDILDFPGHPYTKGLIGCIPALGKASASAQTLPPLAEIPGVVPPLHLLGKGCAFADRCNEAHDACKVSPQLKGSPHAVACHAYRGDVA